MSTFKIEHLAVVSLRTADLPATIHFYRDVIGLTRLAHHGHRPAFDLGNGLFLVIVEAGGEQNHISTSDRFPVLAFAVADLDQAVEHLNRFKIEMPWGIESDLNNRWVQFYDPGGNLIEFAQFALW
ncbi:MAG TPA: VOC family protein [Anaerolineales bacterium]|nr:VOC family protein [Anaerolineales bacterium]